MSSRLLARSNMLYMVCSRQCCCLSYNKPHSSSSILEPSTRTSPTSQHGLLCIDLHLVLRHGHLLYGYEVPQLLLLDHLLVQHSRSTLPEGVALQLGHPLVGTDVVPHQRGLLGSDDGDVDVAAGAEVVEDAGLDGVGAQGHGLVARELAAPLRLEHGHGGQRAGAHGDVGQLVGAAVGVHGEEVRARGVDAGHHQVGADVALVAEQVLLEQRHAGDHARLAARRERVQLQLRRDQRRGKLRVRRRARPRAPDVGRDVVQLLAVLVGDDGARRCARVGCDLKNASNTS